MQAAAHRWLEQLALQLPMTLPPSIMAMSEVRKALPIPVSVLDQYGGVSRFLGSVPGLVYQDQPRMTVSLQSELHALLRARAGARARLALAGGCVGHLPAGGFLVAMGPSG